MYKIICYLWTPHPLWHQTAGPLQVKDFWIIFFFQPITFHRSLYSSVQVSLPETLPDPNWSVPTSCGHTAQLGVTQAAAHLILCS